MFINGVKTAVLLGLLMALLMAIGYGFGRESGMFIGLIFGGIMSFVSYFFSDKIALASVRAQPITREQAPELYDMTQRLAERAGIPMPRLYYSQEPAPNAFATGRNPRHAAVCVTAGLMNMMNGKELEGVIAHELSHVKNRDILISTIAAIIAGAISFLANMMMWFGGGGRHRDNPFGIIGVLMTFFLAPIAAGLIQMAISRSREFAADARGAELAGGPEGLMSALKKLEVGNRQIPMNVNPSESHMFIMRPSIGEGLSNLFRTHPPTEKRIAKLVELMGKGNYATNPYAF
ncbi:MAG: zinc metalloprotease HtpX [Phycisphaerales bacterium]|nr:zinc metalloprotease HtpX [Phycisphaerales bacterium]